ncbi:hypothetical protein V8G54_034395 [Vigna mungo]|uniref:Uncharacterized protein n=1 Tax=Vigna mungo TaxID=3915 RepID=A0AAQ3RJP1_VIGMU
MGCVTRENSSPSRTSNPKKAHKNTFLSLSLIPHKPGRIPLLLPFLFTIDDHVGEGMICILSGDNDLTATVWRWEEDAKSTEVVDGSASGVAMGVSMASSGVLRRLRGLDWKRRMVVVTRWRRRLRVVACSGSVNVARLLGGGPM